MTHKIIIFVWFILQQRHPIRFEIIKKNINNRNQFFLLSSRISTHRRHHRQKRWQHIVQAFGATITRCVVSRSMSHKQIIQLQEGKKLSMQKKRKRKRKRKRIRTQIEQERSQATTNVPRLDTTHANKENSDPKIIASLIILALNCMCPTMTSKNFQQRIEHKNFSRNSFSRQVQNEKRDQHRTHCSHRRKLDMRIELLKHQENVRDGERRRCVAL